MIERELSPRDEADFELLLLEESMTYECIIQHPAMLAALRERNERHAKQLEAAAIGKGPEVKKFFAELAAQVREEYK